MTQVPAGMSGGGAMRPHRGVMILIFGILGFVLCVIFGIVAWVMGNGDLKEMAAGRMDPSGEGLTKAGKICGMISTILFVCFILLYVVIFVIFGLAAVGSAASGGP